MKTTLIVSAGQYEQAAITVVVKHKTERGLMRRARQLSRDHEVYGDNFRQDAFAARVNHITDLISSNFANLNFQLRHDYSPLFRQGGMDSSQIEQIVQRTMMLNKNLIVLPINKRDPKEVAMLPYLLNIPAEYFRIFDRII